MHEISEELQLLLHTQSGVMSLRQANLYGFQRREVRRRIERGVWHWITDSVIAVQMLPLSRSAQLWAAALHYERCALAGSSVLELSGLPEPSGGLIHIIGSPAGRVSPLTGVVVHTSRSFVIDSGGPDRVSTVTAVGQVLRWARSDRQGVFQAIWALQRGLVCLEELQVEVLSLKKSPGTANARRRLRLIDPGVHSMSEFDFAVECRKRGFPTPVRQQRRTDSTGRTRFTDAEFRVNGRTLVVEIDGLGHLATEVMIDDQWRANELLMQGAPVLRIPAIALRMDPDRFFEQLARALQQLVLASGSTSNRPKWLI